MVLICSVTGEDVYFRNILYMHQVPQHCFKTKSLESFTYYPPPGAPPTSSKPAPFGRALYKIFWFESCLTQNRCMGILGPQVNASETLQDAGYPGMTWSRWDTACMQNLCASRSDPTAAWSEILSSSCTEGYLPLVAVVTRECGHHDARHDHGERNLWGSPSQPTWISLHPGQEKPLIRTALVDFLLHPLHAKDQFTLELDLSLGQIRGITASFYHNLASTIQPWNFDEWKWNVKYVLQML